MVTFNAFVMASDGLDDKEGDLHFEWKKVEMLRNVDDVRSMQKRYEKVANVAFAYFVVSDADSGETYYESAVPGMPEYIAEFLK